MMCQCRIINCNKCTTVDYGRVKMADEEDMELASPHNEGTYQAPVGDHGQLRAREEPPATG